MNEYTYEVLIEQIQNFVAEKHMMGYRYRFAECNLLQYKEYLCKHNIAPGVSKETVTAWIDDAKTISSRNSRINLIRQFSLYLNRMGINAYIVPTAYRSIAKNDFCPYIYSQKELYRIFQTADNFGKVGKIPLSDKSFPLVLRMLYGCGLRISEALSLKYGQIDTSKGIITIEDTKFFKNRIVPMHENLTIRLCQYIENCLLLIGDDDYIFPSGKHERISNTTFYHYFRQILSISGIRHIETYGRGPRVHDIRHTFAVQNLKQLDAAGYDMNMVLPILATYMGHTTYLGTGTYLHLVTDLFPQIANSVDERYSNIIPKGGESHE